VCFGRDVFCFHFCPSYWKRLSKYKLKWPNSPSALRTKQLRTPSIFSSLWTSFSLFGLLNSFKKILIHISVTVFSIDRINQMTCYTLFKMSDTFISWVCIC
jgi:hypothetical protein